MKPADYRRFLNEIHANDNYVKIKNGLYASFDTLANDMVDIEKIIPNEYCACTQHGISMA